MKALIFSDIHGSLNACSRVDELIKKHNPDFILLLGDLLYHGPRNDLPPSYNPKGVIPILNNYKDNILAVRGNCEAEVDQMVLSFPVMSTTSQVFVDGLKLTLTHGHIYNEANPVPGAKIMLYGHTHIPVCHKKDDIVFFNPGSTSIPKGGYNPSFGIYENRKLSVLELSNEKEMMALTL